MAQKKNWRNKGNKEIAEAIFDLPKRKKVFQFISLKCYKVDPPVISVPKRYSGFDIYITGLFQRKIDPIVELMASYNLLGESKYARVNIYNLSNMNKAEAELYVGYFERNYLTKQCKLEIVNAAEETTNKKMDE